MDLRESLKLFSLTALSSPKLLRKRYRELIKIHHPDRNPNNARRSTRAMQDLNRAYKILSDSLLDSTPEVHRLIRRGDEALKHAIFIGCLKRGPRDYRAQSIREEIAQAAEILAALEGLPAEYFSTLFSTFLRATELSRPRPLPAAVNTTKFFRHFATADRALDKGIRYFYHNLRGLLWKRGLSAAISYLDDALQLYALLLPKTKDRSYRQRIGTRIELSRLFKLRLVDPRFQTETLTPTMHP